MDTFAESFLAEIVFDHEKHCSSFAVADAIEHFVDFIGRVGLGANGARNALGIEIESGLIVVSNLLGHIPLGLPGFERLGFHPGSEAFVEPGVVPPF